MSLNLQNGTIINSWITVDFNYLYSSSSSSLSSFSSSERHRNIRYSHHQSVTAPRTHTVSLIYGKSLNNHAIHGLYTSVKGRVVSTRGLAAGNLIQHFGKQQRHLLVEYLAHDERQQSRLLLDEQRPVVGVPRQEH